MDGALPKDRTQPRGDDREPGQTEPATRSASQTKSGSQRQHQGTDSGSGDRKRVSAGDVHISSHIIPTPLRLLVIGKLLNPLSLLVSGSPIPRQSASCGVWSWSVNFILTVPLRIVLPHAFGLPALDCQLHSHRLRSHLTATRIWPSTASMTPRPR